jgi:hypothetical protein
MKRIETYRLATAALALLAGWLPVAATETIGVVTSDKLVTPLPDSVVGFQAQPNFLLIIGNPFDSKQPGTAVSAGASRGKPAAEDQSPNGGYNIVVSINTLAPAVNGTPSQSGWHDHPVPVVLVQIVQGTLWVQQADNPGCLSMYTAGSTALVEHPGEIHNIYNFDPKVATVIRSVGFSDRSLASTRTDRPDPITGDPNVASTRLRRCAVNDRRPVAKYWPPSEWIDPTP